MSGGTLLIANDSGITFNAMKKLNRVVARVLEQASVSEYQLSEEAGYHRSTFPRYKIGARDATPEAARALSAALRKRARLLEKLADQLERATQREEG